MSKLTNLEDQISEYVLKRNLSALDTPKNLAIALSVEAAELLELFQWLETGDSQELGEKLTQVRNEIGDVLIYLLALSNKLNLDCVDCGVEKMKINFDRISD